MSILLNFGKDQQGTPSYAPSFPTDIKSLSLLVGAAQSFTVPSNYAHWTVSFGYSTSANIWVSVNNTATPPVGNTFANSNSLLNPAQLKVNAGDVVSCYNNGTAASDFGIALYADS